MLGSWSDASMINETPCAVHARKIPRVLGNGWLLNPTARAPDEFHYERGGWLGTPALLFGHGFVQTASPCQGAAFEETSQMLDTSSEVRGSRYDMPKVTHKSDGQKAAEADVQSFREDLGPFVVAAETTRMAMVFTDAKEPGHPIIFANDAFLSLTGYARNEVLGQDFNFLMEQGTDAQALAKIESEFKGHSEGGAEIQYRRQDGSTFWAQTEVVNTGWVTNEAFLQGYGLAQALPGPLFTFAAYLGSVASPVPNGLAGAAIALVAIFLPGTLLVYGMLPFWDALRSRPGAQAAMRGANAAVVGILGMALYDPVWKSAVVTPGDFALAVTGFLLLVVWRAPSWVVVAFLAAAGALRGAML